MYNMNKYVLYNNNITDSKKKKTMSRIKRARKLWIQKKEDHVANKEGRKRLYSGFRYNLSRGALHYHSGEETPILWIQVYSQENSKIVVLQKWSNDILTIFGMLSVTMLFSL
ncbi:hypothetical protein C2G38_2037775 [Gigaspora rosea]|uniref:Uncharacterized protein n=1 Tax=Gigaspora rosea TaxID=44941 RepID=A0A397VDK9_9GLOM|nr:hypothetical protein C2G38_2037775 [Gigaspora rosea]